MNLEIQSSLTKKTQTKIHTGLPHLPGAEKERARVCIVTADLVGPVKCGGVGTAYTAMAETLTAQWHQVSILYVGHNESDKDFTEWQAFYASKGIKLEKLTRSLNLTANGPHSAVSYRTYQYLKDKEYDVVHFSEMLGAGYYSLLAKRQGLEFQNTTLAVGVHGPTIWHRQSNAETLNQRSDLELDFLEKKSVEYADFLWAPSKHIIHWLIKSGWTVPEECFFQPNALPLSTRLVPDRNSTRRRELVFFGRLETRKGLEIFCDALDDISKSQEIPRKVTFLGRKGIVGGEVDAITYLSRRGVHWNFEWQVLGDLNQFDALKYLSSKADLVVIPSLEDNAPMSIVECVCLGIPFIASNAGGTPELIKTKDHAGCLFNPNKEDLKKKLLGYFKNREKPKGAELANSVSHVADTWCRWHGTQAILNKKKNIRAVPKKLPRVSICLTHKNRPRFLKTALESLKTQSARGFELIVIDDASEGSEHKKIIEGFKVKTKEKCQVKFVQNAESIGAGPSRNKAASLATGDYLLFMDDDNIAKPEEVETFQSVAQRTGADVLVCANDQFMGDMLSTSGVATHISWIPLGPSLSLALLDNVLGDTNFLIRKETFDQMGGFPPRSSNDAEDWEFLAECAFRGYKIEVVPEALYFYRSFDSYTSKYNRYQVRLNSLGPYLKRVPPELHQLFQLLRNTALPQIRIDHIVFSNLDAGNKLQGFSNLNTLAPIFRTKGKRAFNGFEPIHHVKFKNAQTFLKIEILGDDPHFFLPDFDKSSCKGLLFEFELIVLQPTLLKIYYLTKHSPEFDESKTVSIQVKPDTRLYRLSIDREDIVGRIRVDVGDGVQQVVIKSLSVYDKG